MKIRDYSRRNFFKQSTLTGMGVILLGNFTDPAEGRVSFDQERKFMGEVPITSIGDITLEQLRDKYRAELFSRFLPNMDRIVVDQEYGGFMCTVDIRSGQLLDTKKTAWYEGRGMWVYSFLYNNLEQNPHFLEIARKSKDLILKQQPSDNSFWASSYTKEGSPLSGPGDIFCNLYIAEGLAEYSRASGERKYFKLAKKIILSSLLRYDRPDYRYSSEKKIIGPRLLNHWMVLLRTSTQILEYEADPEIEQLAERCVDAIMNHHLNPEFELLNETLSHDLNRLSDNEFAQFASIGIGIQTLWMVLFEAARKKDVKLYQRAKELFKRHISVGHDSVYGGYFNSLDQVNNFVFKLHKVLSLHEEVLIGTLFLIEHEADPWAEKCFTETYAYVQKNFAYPNFKFWTVAGDRKVNNYQTNRAEHYHHPRHLMTNLLSLERMIRHGHKTSGIFG